MGAIVDDDPWISALRAERESCQARGLSARVAAIDAEIARLTGVPSDSEDTGPDQTAPSDPPRRRRQREERYEWT